MPWHLTLNPLISATHDFLVKNDAAWWKAMAIFSRNVVCIWCQLQRKSKPVENWLIWWVWIDFPFLCNVLHRTRRKKTCVIATRGQPYLPIPKSEVRRDGIILKDETTGANLLGFVFVKCLKCDLNTSWSYVTNPNNAPKHKHHIEY